VSDALWRERPVLVKPPPPVGLSFDEWQLAEVTAPDMSNLKS
jgi:hypothetical protein